MKKSEARVEELARRISDGSSIDWNEVESSFEGEVVPKAVRRLRIVSDVAQIHSPHRDDEVVEFSQQGSPQVWGPLRILDKIGEGAFSAVYRARDTRLDRDVALKLLLEAQVQTDRDRVAVNEGRSLAQVRHPNVVTVHGADVIEGRVGLWMELIQGETLGDRLGEDGPFGAHEATVVGQELCSALAAVHEAGLVHRDIKAENVMREDGGRIVLMDFGVGMELLKGTDQEKRPVTSGTPLYMAPELFEGENATIRSDIYSLGVLLYNLVTGSYPVRGQTIDELHAAHKLGECTPLRDQRPDLPTTFVRVVEKALASDPTTRYATAGEMERALSETRGPAGKETSQRKTLSSLSPLSRYKTSLVLALVAIVALAAGWYFYRHLNTHYYTVQAGLHRSSGTGTELLVPGDRLAPGDGLFLEFSASERVYVYVLNQDERGESYLLFPLPGYDLENPLSARETHHLPGSRNGQEILWQVTSAGGREHFLILASMERLTEFENQIEPLNRPQLGRPVMAARLPDEAIDELRGLGGLVETTPTQNTASTPIFEVAKQLANQTEQVQGIWARQIDLENP